MNLGWGPYFGVFNYFLASSVNTRSSSNLLSALTGPCGCTVMSYWQLKPSHVSFNGALYSLARVYMPEPQATQTLSDATVKQPKTDPNPFTPRS